MYRYKKVLVRLTADELDRDIIRYAAKVSKLAESEELCFFYSYQASEEASLIEDDEKDHRAQFDLIQGKVKKLFRGFKKTKVRLFFSEDQEVYDILKLAKAENFDLIITSKLPKDSSVAEKLARKATCSVMAIPPESDPAFKHVLVLMDFSHYAYNATEIGIAFASAQKLKKIQSLHVYGLPVGYHKTGMIQKQFQHMHEEWIKKEYDNLTHKLDLKNLKLQTTCKMNPLFTAAVKNYIKSHKIDLVVMGCRGKKCYLGVTFRK